MEALLYWKQWLGESEAAGEALPPVVLGFFLLGLKSSKESAFTVPKTGSKIDQRHVDGCAFFMSIAVQKSQESSRRSKILNS